MSMSKSMSKSGEMNMSTNMNMNKNMNMSRGTSSGGKTFCTDCAHASNCTKQFDENERKNCPLVEDDEPLRYRNSEGYPDPTAYFALRNMMRKPHGGQQHKTKKHRPRTQVVYYD